MSYEILNDDVLDKDDIKSEDEKIIFEKNFTKKKKKKSDFIKNKNFKKNNNFGKNDKEKKYFLIHLTIIIIIVLALFIYIKFFYTTSNIPKDENNLILIGKIKNQSLDYIGDLDIKTDNMSLKTDLGNFKSDDTEIIIKNFTGKIFMSNYKLIFIGKALKFNYGKNNINTKNNFTLTLEPNTQLNLFLNNFCVNMVNGKIYLSDYLNYNFKNTTICLEKFNFTLMIKNGLTSFYGNSERFDLSTFNNRLKIIYNNSFENGNINNLSLKND